MVGDGWWVVGTATLGSQPRHLVAPPIGSDVAPLAEASPPVACRRTARRAAWNDATSAACLSHRQTAASPHAAAFLAHASPILASSFTTPATAPTDVAGATCVCQAFCGSLRVAHTGEGTMSWFAHALATVACCRASREGAMCDCAGTICIGGAIVAVILGWCPIAPRLVLVVIIARNACARVGAELSEDTFPRQFVPHVLALRVPTKAWDFSLS